MSLNDDEASLPLLPEDPDEGNDDGSKSQMSSKTGDGSKLSKKSRIKRKFGLKKKGDKDEKDPEEELNKVNDNFWPIGNRSLTTQEKLAIAGGTVAGNIMCTIFVRFIYVYLKMKIYFVQYV